MVNSNGHVNSTCMKSKCKARFDSIEGEVCSLEESEARAQLYEEANMKDTYIMNLGYELHVYDIPSPILNFSICKLHS